MRRAPPGPVDPAPDALPQDLDRDVEALPEAVGRDAHDRDDLGSRPVFENLQLEHAPPVLSEPPDLFADESPEIVVVEAPEVVLRLDALVLLEDLREPDPPEARPHPVPGDHPHPGVEAS